jgi:hypothetical protein
MRQRLWTLVMSVTVLSLSLAGCGSSTSASDDARHRTLVREQLAQQAQDALTRWDAAVTAADLDQLFVVRGSKTHQIGVWEPAVAANNAAALRAGMLDSSQRLTALAPPTAQVTWSDGTTRALATMSAAKALIVLAAAGTHDCSGCTPLRVTGARFTTGTVQTTRGTATVPVWEFSLDQTAVTVTQLAVDLSGKPVFIPASHTDPYYLAEGVSIVSATAGTDDRQLIVGYPATVDLRDTVCADYTFQAVESSTAVVVAVAEFFRWDGSCPGRTHTTTLTKVVTLAQPLGDRTVLEVVDGRPVPRTALGQG